MPFDMIGALRMATRAPVANTVKSSTKTSNPRGLAAPSASYSAEAVPLPTPDTSGPENRLQELAEYCSHEATEARLKEKLKAYEEARRNAPKGAARRVAIAMGEYVPPVWKDKTKAMSPDELEEYQNLRKSKTTVEDNALYTPAHLIEYKRNIEEFELLKAERPWHGINWPHLRAANGKYVHFSSMADPNYRGTETQFLEYAQVYVAQAQGEYKAIMPVWIAKAKEALGILEIKEKQAAVRTEILIEGRADGLKSMHALAGTRKKNCTGAELNELCQVQTTQPLGMFPLSTKQMQMAEQRNLLTYPMPMHDALQYCCINWLLFDMPRYTAFKELSRSLGRGNRSYINDDGVQCLIRNGKPTKAMPDNLTSNED